MAWLHIDSNLGRATIELESRTTVGRDPANLLVLSDPQVSSFHCILERANEGFLVTDCNSTNGTWVNGARVVLPTLLRHGDSLLVGSRRLEFSSSAASVAARAGVQPVPPTVIMESPFARPGSLPASAAYVPLEQAAGRGAATVPQPAWSPPTTAAAPPPTGAPIYGAVPAPPPPASPAGGFSQGRPPEHPPAVPHQRGSEPDGEMPEDVRRVPQDHAERGPAEVLSSVLGRGLQHLDQTRAITPYSDLLRALNSAEAQHLQGQLQGLMQSLVVNGVYWNQKRKMSWFERHLGQSHSKNERDRQAREVAGYWGGVAAGVVLELAKKGLERRAQAKEREACAEHIAGVLRIASLSADGEVPICNQPIIANVFNALKLTSKQKQAVARSQRALHELPPVRLSTEQSASVGYLAVTCAANNLGLAAISTRQRRELRAVCEVLGLSATEGDALVQDALQNYAEDSLEQHAHYVRLQHIVQDAGVQLRWDGERLRENAVRLAAYDPLKEERERNQWLLLNGSALALTGGLAYVAGGAQVAAIATARGVLRVLNSVQGGSGAQDVDWALNTVGQATNTLAELISAGLQLDGAESG